MAGKKEATQKAGPSGQKEKNRKETEDPTGAKSISEDAGRRPAQDMQKREAHKDLKDLGEFKKPSMTKRRQARKVATMVKRLKKNPEDGELQPPIEGEAVLASGGGWDAQQQATVTAYAQSRGMQPREVLQALVNSMEKTLRKEKGGNPAGQIPPSSAKQKREAAGKVE
jgi:Mg2+ and Co2+ transporter CorA